jgi:hypothetical protein
VIRKILVGSIVALCCLLIGLLVIFFYINTSVNKKNSILSYIPVETQFVLKIKQTSVTLNEFFSNEIITDLFKFSEIKSAWKSIDSVTSRNYKTTEILLKNTSYVCLDSSGHFLILLDLNKKANEHFIDQFLVNSTSLRKIEKFKEGYKAFFPKEGEPMFYFVKHNVFAVSSNPALIFSSLQHGQTEKSEETISLWDERTEGVLSIWSSNSLESSVFKQFGISNFTGNWSTGFTTSAMFDIRIDRSKMQINGTLEADTSNEEFSLYNLSSKEQYVYIYEGDSGIWENKFYSLQVKDSLNHYQPLAFIYSSFPDSASNSSFLLVSKSPIALSRFELVSKDSSVQTIPMADDNIEKIAVFEESVCKRIIAIMPFKADSAKLFATIYNGYLFIANSTETILAYASGYPKNNFIKKKLEASTIVFYSGSRINSRSYLVDYTWKFTNQHTISFTSEIKLKDINQ